MAIISATFRSTTINYKEEVPTGMLQLRRAEFTFNAISSGRRSRQRRNSQGHEQMQKCGRSPILKGPEGTHHHELFVTKPSTEHLL